MTLTVDGLRQSYGSKEVLKGVSFEAGPGMVTVIGPNGAGKSTLVKALAGTLPAEGEASYRGMNLLGGCDGMKISYMPQENPRPTNMTVLETVLLGMLETLSWKVSKEEVGKAYGALAEVNVSHLAGQRADWLSGGQLQMVMVAQCLVGDPEFLILDEPANNLDMRNELDLFDRISGITRERGMTTLTVLHDINFASRYSDTIVVMKDGTVHSHGPPREIVTEAMLLDVFGVEVEIHENSEGKPMVFPMKSVARRT